MVGRNSVSPDRPAERMNRVITQRATGWMSRALCAYDPTLTIQDFYPEPNGGSDRKAMKVCFACPVRLDCLTYALKHEKVGVWGGSRPDQRARAIRLGMSVERVFDMTAYQWKGRNRPTRRRNKA